MELVTILFIILRGFSDGSGITSCCGIFTSSCHRGTLSFSLSTFCRLNGSGFGRTRGWFDGIRGRYATRSVPR